MIRDLVKEYFLIVKLKWSYRGNKLIPERWKDGDKGNVVLLPGLNEKYVFLGKIAETLNNSGFQIHVTNYNPNDRIENISVIVADYIKNNKLKNVVLLGHSKGGLTAKYIMDYFPEVNNVVLKSISVATPYDGTVFGWLRIRNLWQLIPGSEMMLKINKTKTNLDKVINIYPKTDNHVIPNKSLILKGAQNIMIEIFGHTSVIESEITMKEVMLAVNGL